jgi:hypothetical protein
MALSRRLEMRYAVFYGTVKPVLNGIARVQNIFPLKPDFRLIKIVTGPENTSV